MVRAMVKDRNDICFSGLVGITPPPPLDVIIKFQILKFELVLDFELISLFWYYPSHQCRLVILAS
jgi:hypothetical protein